jgi:hypothetical protein
LAQVLEGWSNAALTVLEVLRGVYLGLRPLGAGSSLGYNMAGLWPFQKGVTAGFVGPMRELVEYLGTYVQVPRWRMGGGRVVVGYGGQMVELSGEDLRSNLLRIGSLLRD